MAKASNSSEEIPGPGIGYFEQYKITQDDFEAISEGLDIMSESGLFEQGVLSEIRVVTHDSKNLYVFTKGEHVSNDRFVVEKISPCNKSGFNLFKIAHSGFIGKTKGDYLGARSWLLCDEIETTAVHAKKFPNENVLYQPDVPQPIEVLDVVSIAPKEPFEQLNESRYDYLTDVVFHETGHIEHRRLEDWHEGEESVGTFPSTEQEEEFKKLLEKSKLFPGAILATIVDRISKEVIREMYPLLIDREASRRYRPQKLKSGDAEFSETLAKTISGEGGYSNEDLVRSKYAVGRLLVRILEEQFPEFTARKAFVRKILSRRPR